LTYENIFARCGVDLGRIVQKRHAELAGVITDRYIPRQSLPNAPDTEIKTVSGLHHIKIEVERIRDNAFPAKGVGNSF
jgi:hypothetical protein